jgi:hypothetical protein
MSQGWRGKLKQSHGERREIHQHRGPPVNRHGWGIQFMLACRKVDRAGPNPLAISWQSLREGREVFRPLPAAPSFTFKAALDEFHTDIAPF